jgi:uncharacterized protein
LPLTGFIINNMKITDDLLAAAHLASHDYPVQEVFIGLYWTAVYSHQVGLAATQADASCCFAEDIQGAGHLHEMSAFALAEYLRSQRPLEACVGMAALNSLLPLDNQDSIELNARDLIMKRGQGKNVALIGHFAFTEELRKEAMRLWVLELSPTPGDLPADQAPELLPQADVIGITASTLLNQTFDDLASLFPPHALVVMLGPSTPLCRILFDYGVDVLAGARVSEPEHIFHLISQSSPLHRPTGLQRLTLVRDRSLGLNL